MKIDSSDIVENFIKAFREFEEMAWDAEEQELDVLLSAPNWRSGLEDMDLFVSKLETHGTDIEAWDPSHSVTC